MIEFTHRPDWRWLSLGAVLLILLLLWSYRTARGGRINGRRPLWLPKRRLKNNQLRC